MNVGDKIIAVNVEPLKGNDEAPKLELGKEYEIIEIAEDSRGNPHFDVGLLSGLKFVRSWETKEELPRGDSIHWCHPSRFEKA